MYVCVCVCVSQIVVDVGAGTGVLSLFAAMAGAKKVYAIEASAMALHARALCEANKWGDRVEVVQSKVEDFRLPEEVGRADILIRSVHRSILPRTNPASIHSPMEVFPGIKNFFPTD